MVLWPNVAGMVAELVKTAQDLYSLQCALFDASSKSCMESAHLLGVVLGNVRVGEFLRHGCGCLCCDVWLKRDDRYVSDLERMCES